MSSWLYSVSIPVGVLLLAFVGSRLRQWMTKTSKPRFSRETGTSARTAINNAVGVFNSAISLGGSLRYPWKINEMTFTETEIGNSLRAASAEIVDKDLQKFIVTIKKQLRQVYASARPIIPGFWYDGMTESASQLKDRKLDMEFASRQRDAAEVGLIVSEAALERLDKLSANL